MSQKRHSKNQTQKTAIEPVLPEDFSLAPKERKIFEYEPLRLISNNALHKRKKVPIATEVILDERSARLPAEYLLSNIPIFEEKKCLQSYHFVFSNEQLKQMIEEPKIIIDRYHNVFQTSGGIVHRSSFYAVAPHARQENGIPMLYRFSITRVLGEEQDHYNISLYAVAGGKQDGFLFLGRLDNDVCDPHSFMAQEITKTFAKRHNATLTAGETPSQQMIRRKFKEPVNFDSFGYDMYSIPFPHMHQPSAHYEIGDNPEIACPKFIRKLANNNFEQNLSAMLKAFRISPTPRFRNTNQNVYSIAKQEKKITTLSDKPNPKPILDEILDLEAQARKIIKVQWQKNPQKPQKAQRKKNANSKQHPDHKQQNQKSAYRNQEWQTMSFMHR